MITAKEIRERYLKFFETKGHAIVTSASLIPRENDSSVLFTTAGMHPLVPYLMGENHPKGKRIVNVQKCIRTGDIDEVGDNRHLTFFEMLGNWSFGSYFKEEAIRWSFEFLIDRENGLGIDPKRIYATTFRGEDGIPKDEESIRIWKEVIENANIKVEISEKGEVTSEKRIIPLGKEDNFWIAGETGPCGPDTEMFYDTRPEEGEINGNFEDLVKSGRLIEIWNDVFMEYEKVKVKSKNSKEVEYKYEKLKQKNVDTGMGLERTLAVLSGEENVFETELFSPIFDKIEEISGKKYLENKKEFRIIADHIKAGTFIISEGVSPSNAKHGYVLRRLIRRAVRYGKVIGIEDNFTKQLAEVAIVMYKEFYPELEKSRDKIFEELEKEENKFKKALERGLKEFNKAVDNKLLTEDGYFLLTEAGDKLSIGRELSGKIVFNLYTTYGFPIELIREIANEKGIVIDEEGFEKEMKKHQELSRTASAGQFKGGLSDDGEETKKLHTTAHLMLAALRKVLGDHVHQKGSNITSERLRFDFSHPEKMTDEQKKEVEDLINEVIGKELPITYEEMTPDEAARKGAEGVFGSKYGELVKVYKIGNDEVFSYEICGGPHIENTKELGKFKIKKEESSGAGVRRIKAILK